MSVLCEFNKSIHVNPSWDTGLFKYQFFISYLKHSLTSPSSKKSLLDFSVLIQSQKNWRLYLISIGNDNLFSDRLVLLFTLWIFMFGRVSFVTDSPRLSSIIMSVPLIKYDDEKLRVLNLVRSFLYFYTMLILSFD